MSNPSRYFQVNAFSYFVILDIITTYLCIAFGGIEYNPIASYMINHSMFLYITTRIFVMILIISIANYTLTFEKKRYIYFLRGINFIYLLIIILNCMYIITKLW